MGILITIPLIITTIAALTLLRSYRRIAKDRKAALDRFRAALVEGDRVLVKPGHPAIVLFVTGQTVQVMMQSDYSVRLVEKGEVVPVINN